MDDSPSLEAAYAPSEDIVARDIDGELLIVPLTADVGGQEGALFTLNETGRAVWDRLDGRQSLCDAVQSLSTEFDAPLEDIREDVLGLVAELLKRGILVKVS